MTVSAAPSHRTGTAVYVLDCVQLTLPNSSVGFAPATLLAERTHNVHRFRTAALTSIAAVAMSLAPGLAPAEADVAAFSDRAEDARPTLDIERVRVNNGKRIVVTTTFDNLRRSFAGGIAVYFDTRGADRGPEYRAAGGINAQGTDWQASRLENWRAKRAQLLLRCDIDMRVSYRSDKVTFDIARRCFKRPGRIRVAELSTDRRASPHDWAPRRHRFYDWVRR